MSSSKHRKPAKSSRVPPQAREYITELAEDRELERFMAFSSTASSGASGSTHSCALGTFLAPGLVSTDAREAGSRPESVHRRRPRSSGCPLGKASPDEHLLELPPSPPLIKPANSQLHPLKPQESQLKTNEYTIIPILMDNNQGNRLVAATQTMSQSVEDLRTPTKPPKEMHTKKTQTPESAVKSHKRLEWDPAADVGYYKRAVSTSNISTLERSVLEECGWRQPIQQRSETDLDRLQRREVEEASPVQDRPTPPLASSTFVNPSDRGKPSRSRLGSLGSSLGSRKEVSLEINRSGPRKDDSGSSSRQKDSRSISRKESTHSSSKTEDTQCSSRKEVDENSSRQEGTQNSSKKEATQSGFQRESSQNMSRKEDSLSSSKKDDIRLSSRVQDPQISSRRESLSSSRRESLSSYRRDDSRLSSQNSSRMGSQVSSRLGESRSSSRRESQATSLYGSSAASSFDYHIHMGQELVVDKLEQQEKKQPGKEQEKKEQQKREQDKKDELKRVQEQREQQKHKQKEHVEPQHRERDQRRIQQLDKDQRKAELREKEREQERQFTAAQFEKILGSRRRENKENQQPQSQPRTETIPSTSSSSIGVGSGSGAGPRGDLDLGIDLLCSLVKTRSLSQGQKKKLVRDIARRLACLDLAESSSSLRSLKSNQSSKAKEQPKVPSPLKRQDVATNTSQCGSRGSSKGEPATLPVPAPRKRGTAGTPSPLPTSFSASGSTSASHELVTQKTNVPTRDAASTDADAEPSDLQEWLNPMTQSEIEYERRLKGGFDSERRNQLNWIDTEIRRLQALQQLLGDAITMLPRNSVHIETDKGSAFSSDKLLSAVPSVQLPTSERCSGGQEEPPAEQQAESSVEVESAGTPSTPRPPVRVESVGVPPRKLPPTPASISSSDPATPPTPPPPPPPHHLDQQKAQHRKKMATPVLISQSSSSGGGRSESVCSFVQQRQRQFREHYQNQQQQQLLLLKQQQLYQQQQQLYQQQQHHICQQRQQQGTHVRQQQFVCQRHNAQQTRQQHEEQEQYIQMQYAQAAGSAYATLPHLSVSAGYSCADNEGAIYYQVLNSQGAAGYVQAAVVATSRSTTTTTSSASSMMCISSEMSIPMGMVNTCETTTTTTTHQYDDADCRRARRRPKEARRSESVMQRQTLQVRPRAIAYVIQFTATGGSEVLPETRSLQDQLQLARPEFCAKSKQRKAILNQMQMIRNVRRRELDNLLGENTSLETLDRRLLQLPPPATSRLRIFSTREMKAMTTKRCQSLPEVLAAQNREQEERRRRCNRLMRDVFNKRLQNRVANGQLSLNHSRTII
ncbi:Alstrom syndrome protein 1 homolog a isoform X2 [Drosophila rhopaloa]|uniref:ALMS motif domain-containing protein n=1 Tax=Drosophila rhopaloa TaxID=1041015 RepID=A0ABM5JEA6_DRORH|nr:Alstrom syndrome protein 1 homolog a isoform X2 [Drosophila rhopaloa]